jgi:hypothetical protein
MRIEIEADRCKHTFFFIVLEIMRVREKGSSLCVEFLSSHFYRA